MEVGGIEKINNVGSGKTDCGGRGDILFTPIWSVAALESLKQGV